MDTEELAYLCKFYEFDGVRSISYGLGKTEATITATYRRMERNGIAGKYRRIWDQQFEE